MSNEKCCSRCQPIAPAAVDKCCHDDHGHDHDHHGHSHDHDHHHAEIEKKDIVMFTAGAAIFVAALFMDEKQIYTFLTFFTAYLLVGWEILFSAIKNLVKGKVFDENFLMSIATVGAFAIGEYPEGVAVMLFFRVGEFFQDMAVAKSRRSIESLMDIRPDYANVTRGGKTTTVNPQDVAVGELIVIKAGERVPLDGVIQNGKTTLDVSALTGESLPKEVKEGDEILSGSINKTGLITVKTTKPFDESTVSKILNLVQNAGSKKAKTENFITKFAGYYTPFVVFSALALAFLPPLFLGFETLSEWFGRALVFLVVSCPCALVVSIPLAFFGGIGGASKNGILVKGGNFLEALNGAKTVVFDKTGTLTEGVFSVTEIQTKNGFDKQTVLEFAAYAEHYSNHPIAMGIKNSFKGLLDETKITSHEELSGYGVRAVIDGKTVLAGNEKLLLENNIPHPNEKSQTTAVYVAIDSVYAGRIRLEDKIKQDGIKAIESLKELGVTDIVMLTGDNEESANLIAKKLGIQNVYASLLPHQKVEILESIISKAPNGQKTVFVGDGINDAPSLARADVGIAMGGVGSDAAIEAADVVIMNDEISKVASAVKIARKTNIIVWQNIAFALGVKGVIMIMGAFGVATMWEAVFGDVGVALIAVLNATRILNTKA